ncbi:MAG: DUF6106 family protein [Firmicutes bacterium]|nr:DUF6106 family protein [Bacillota bacterium]
MFSDIICEQLVKRKIGPKQMVIAAVIVSVGLIISLFLRALGIVVDRTLGMMGIFLFAIGIFVTIYFVRFFIFVEYEYSFVNGELTIDRISAKSKRKHMMDVAVKSFEKIGKYEPEKVKNLNVDTVRDYSADPYASDAVYAYYKDGSGRKILLIFSPNEKLIGSIKPYVNGMMFREAFPNFKSASKPIEQ